MTVAKNSFLVLVTYGVSFATGLVSSIFTARFLGPDGRGVLALINTTANILVLLAGLGLGYSLAYFLGKRRITHAQALGIMTAGSLGSGGAFAVGGIAAAGLLQQSVLRGVGIPSFIAGVASIPAVMFIDLWYTSRTIAGDFAGPTRLQSTAAVANLLVTVLLLVGMNAGVGLLLLGTTTVTWICALVAWVSAFRRDGISLALPDGLPAEIARYGLVVYLGSLVNSVYLRLDAYVLNAFGTNAEVGQYSVAVTLNEKLWLAESSVQQATLPHVIGQSRSEAARIAALTARTSVIITAVPALLLGLLAPLIIPLLYGEAFSPAVVPLQILLIGTVVYPAGKPLANFFSGQLGRPLVTSSLAAGTAVVSVLLYLLLIPRFGASGAAAASSLVYVATAVVLAVLFTRAAGMSLGELLTPTRDDFNVYRSIARRLVDRLRRP